MKHPLVVGGGMAATIIRDGAIVAHCKPAEFEFVGEPATFNFNVFVASSET